MTAELPDQVAAAYLKHRELSSVLCDDLDGWDGGLEVGGRSKREGI